MDARDRIVELIRTWYPDGGKFLTKRLADEICALSVCHKEHCEECEEAKIQSWETR